MAAWGAAPIIPRDLASVEGNSGSTTPFNSQGATSRRYQQVFSASEFDNVSPSGEFIDGLAFRVDASFTGQSSGGRLEDVQISLSTTGRSPDNLNTFFAVNVGGDNLVVYGRKQLTLYASISPDRPQAFDVFIPLDRPFYFRPNDGNLLLDIRIYSFSNSIPTAPLDGANRQGDSVSSLIADSVTATTGSISTEGFVTTIFTTRSPALEISKTNSNLSLKWFYSPGPFALETTTNLFAANSWGAVPQPVISNNAYFQVSMPMPTNSPGRYYRLRYQRPP